MMVWMDGPAPFRDKFSGKVSKSLCSHVMMLIPSFSRSFKAWQMCLTSPPLFPAGSLPFLSLSFNSGPCLQARWEDLTSTKGCHTVFTQRLEKWFLFLSSGSGMRFSELVSDCWYTLLHPSFLVWPLTVLPHIQTTCWHILTHLGSLSLKLCSWILYFPASFMATFLRTCFHAID